MQQLPYRQVLHFVHVAGDALDDTRVVARADDRAFVPLQCFDELAPRGAVEVVGRLVEEEDVRRLDEKLGQRDPASFAAREHAHRLEHVVALEQELPEDGPQLHIWRAAGHGAHLFDDGAVVVERFVLVLVVIAGAGAFGPLDDTLCRCDEPRGDAQEGALPAPVRADEHHLLAALDVQVHIHEDEVVAVGMADMLHHQHVEFGAAVRGQDEVDLVLFLRALDALNLRDHLFA